MAAMNTSVEPVVIMLIISAAAAATVTPSAGLSGPLCSHVGKHGEPSRTIGCCEGGASDRDGFRYTDTRHSDARWF